MRARTALTFGLSLLLASLGAPVAAADSTRSTDIPPFAPADESWLPGFAPSQQDITRYVTNDANLERSLISGASVLSGDERNPLPGNPNNMDGYYCATYEDDNCAGRSVSFHNQLPPCETEEGWNCVRALEFVREGVASQARLVRQLDLSGPLDQSRLGPTPWGTLNTAVNPVTNFPGDRERDLPPGGTVSIWAMPGLAPDNFFAVSVSMKGTTSETRDRLDLHSFYAAVIPVIAHPISPRFAPALISVRDQDGHVGVGGADVDTQGRSCIFADMTNCFVRAEHPDGLRIKLVANLSDAVSGWLHGRLANPSIAIQRVDAFTNRVEITGEPVSIPVDYQDFVTDELPSELRFSRPDWYQSSGTWYGTWNIFADGQWRLDRFEQVMPLLDDRAEAEVEAWVVRAVVGWELPDCLKSDSRLVGLVTTDAMMYNGGPPNFANGRLTYRVAGLHNDSDGNVKRGSYSLTMRSDAARCLYGFSSAPVTAEISVVSEDGTEQVATTSVWERDGWLQLSAQNFTFSAPTIEAVLTQKKPDPIRLVCLKSSKKIKGPKRVVVVGSVDTPPKCPKGYRRK